MTEFKHGPELMEVPEPTPGPGEVVIKVGGSGACHSDLHFLYDFDASMAPWNLPFTLGHENAGWVHTVGTGVRSVAPGDAVAVYGAWGCGTCTRCSLGVENYCDNVGMGGIIGGLGIDGGMADYFLVPSERFLLPLPKGLDPVTGAALTDAGLTPYHAIRRSWSKMTPDATVVVIGVGGLGHMAVQIARATTASQVIAVDVKPEALALASKFGAHHTVVSGDTAAEQIMDLTGGRGADVIVDFVGAAPTMEMARGVARSMSDVTIVGIGGGTMPVSFFTQKPEINIAISYWGSRTELAELLALAARGDITVESTNYSLEDGAKAYEDLHDGKVTGRAVVVP
ncbi:NAD(P)-dependent alcohol dehydrogenase [Mycolicibacterium sp.]|jgi:propanol-preferring alcohol dehydrogenase|uniref:NAD(P)-dependent alcohol dehydrogenase n=1 Tax=Mycolicibacterium sp. TaxID=2320850 RepID=UPI0028AF613C|nr:NAD(P)-dependent alcohol dehydrogenase [Mycolicibacterium sp.]